MAHQRTPIAALVAVGALVAAGSVLALAVPAQAHNYLVSSTPEAGEILTQLPEQFSVETNDTLLDLAGNGAGFGILIQDADGTYYGDGCFSISGASLSTDAALGAPGTYTLTWQLVSTDAHPVSDDYEFEWAPEGDVTASEGSAEAPTCGGENTVAQPDDESVASEPVDESGVYAALPWIGGAVLAIGLAIGVTLFLVRPKKNDTAND